MSKPATTPAILTADERLARLEGAVAELAATVLPHLSTTVTSLGPAVRADLTSFLDEIRAAIQREKALTDLAADEERVAATRRGSHRSAAVKFNGYASVTGRENAYDMGFYREWITPGAFKKSLAENPDVVLTIEHGQAGSCLPIARTTGGTLKLSEDGHGLAVDADLDPDDPDVDTLARKMARGDLDGQMSFCFRVPSGRQRWSSDYEEREIQECDIHRGDVSVVTQGANPATTSSLDALRSAVAGAGGRSTVAERKQLAEAIGNAVIVEMRSFTLAGKTYEVRSGRSAGRAGVPVQSVDPDWFKDSAREKDQEYRARLAKASVMSPRPLLRKGATISAATKGTLKQAIAHHDAATALLNGLMSDGSNNVDEDENTDESLSARRAFTRYWSRQAL